MKKFFALLLFVGITFSMTSCFLTKKKCDCPKFGKANTEQRERNS